jgi:hypothetical protein
MKGIADREVISTVTGALLGKDNRGGNGIMTSGREHKTEGKACQSNILESQL